MGFLGKLVKGVGSFLFGPSGSSAISAGASVLGNLIGSKSNSDTNATNMQINQMNNDFNKKMAEQSQQWNLENMAKQQEYNMSNMKYQNQFNSEMMNRQLMYNGAQAQANRLRAAGLNPALTMGQGGQAGIVQSGSGGSPSSSTPQAGASSPIGMQAFRPDFSSISGTLNTLADINAQKEVRNAQVNALNADAAKASSEADTNRGLFELRKEGLIRQNDVNRITYLRTFQSLASDARKARAEAENAEWAIKLQQGEVMHTALLNTELGIRLQYLPQEMQNALSMALAQINNMNADTKLKSNLAYQALQNAYKSIAETEGINVNNGILRRSANSIVSKNYWDSRNSKFNAFGSSWNAASVAFDYHNKGLFSNGDWYTKSMNTLLGPLKGILSGTAVRSFK